MGKTASTAVFNLNIQSKLIVILLLVALASITTVGWISWSNGRDALKAAALNQLTSLRASKKVQIESFFRTVRNQTSNLADDRMIVTAMRELDEGFARFKSATVSPAWNESLKSFYRRDFLPQLTTASGEPPRLESYLPTTPEGVYAQYLYIAKNPYPAAERYKLNDAGDGSAYSAAHRRYQPIFSKFIRDFRYNNLVLVNDEGDVVYTNSKSVVFGTNLLNGPYSDTSAANLFRSLRKADNVGEVKVEDFTFAPFAAGDPAALMGAAIFDGNRQIGVMFLRFPLDELNRVMTDDFGWIQDGLGRSGEIFLAGPEMLMRSRSRLLHENPDLFFKQLSAAGYSPRDIDLVRRMGTATMAQYTRTAAVENALAGRTGDAILRNYRGVEVLTSYSPLHLAGLRWVIVSEMESAEAFAPMSAMTREILLSSLAMIAAVTILAAFLGHRFVRPIFRLLDGVKRVEAGERNVVVAAETADEFADLTEAFNHISESIVSTTEDLEMRTRERDDLLCRLLPAAAAARVREGKPSSIDEYPEISVLYARLLPGGPGRPNAAEQYLTALTEMVAALDDAAALRGAERLSSNGVTYVACCGIAGHAVRIVDFAQDVLGIVRRFRSERRAGLRVQIGVDSGPAGGGLSGRTRLIYYLAGETVSTAAILCGHCPPDTILVARQVYAPASHMFQPGAPVQVTPPGGGATISAWQLKYMEDRIAGSADRDTAPRSIR